MNSAVEYIISKLKECDDFHNRCDYLLDHSEITYLLEYIEELQQENKELNDSITWWTNRFKAVERDNRELRKRIDKAIEYIEQFDTFQLIHSTDGLIERLREKTKNELLEILKGGNNE